MQSPQAKLRQIERILALWPQASDDGDELLRGYLLAVDDYPFCDVEGAVDALIKGIAPGVNPSFRPKPSEVGAECRRRMNLRLDSEHRAKMARPALPPPDVERTPESRARVKAMVDKALGNLKSVTADEDAATAQRKAEMWAKTNARFDPSADEADMAARLGFTAGDPEGERDVA